MAERLFSIGGAMLIILVACLYLIIAFIYDLYESLINDDSDF